MMTKQVLVISDSYDQIGFDVRADIRTIMSLGYSSTAVVPSIHDENSDYDVAEAMELVLSDGVPDAVKLGFLPDARTVNLVAEKLAFKNVNNVVLVPSIISGDGNVLMDEAAYDSISSKLMPLASLIILNSMEAELISGIEFSFPSDLMRAAKVIYAKYGFAVLISGSSLSSGKSFLFDGKHSFWRDEIKPCDDFRRGEYDFSSVICCGLAGGLQVEEAVTLAEDYLSGRRQTAPEPVVEIAKEVKVEEVNTPLELTSPAKSLRDLARAFENNYSNKKESSAVTSAIEPPAPGPKSEIVDLINPEPKEENSSDLTLRRLQEMRERLERMTR